MNTYEIIHYFFVFSRVKKRSVQVENLMGRIYKLRSKWLCQPLYSENEFNTGLKLLNCNAGSAFVYLSLLKYYFTFFCKKSYFRGIATCMHRATWVAVRKSSNKCENFCWYGLASAQMSYVCNQKVISSNLVMGLFVFVFLFFLHEHVFLSFWCQQIHLLSIFKETNYCNMPALMPD